jgi:hypothetical protein
MFVRNKYLKFSLNLIILISLFGISDQLIGRLMKCYYFKQESGILYQTTYAIDSTTADILVFGSSRANHHYVPQIFEEKLGLSFYNSGRDGNYLLYNYPIFKSIVSRYTPKVLIFDINPREFFYEKTSYERLSSLLPYYKTHPEIRKTVELRSPFERFKMLSQIYPYNSNLLTITVGNLEINRSRIKEVKGYVPLLDSIIDTTLFRMKSEEGILDSNKIFAIKDITKYCITKNILLILVESPTFGRLQKTTSTLFIENLVQENKIAFWDFSNYADFITKPGFFRDRVHLNDSGARYFSSIVADSIRPLILPKRIYFKKIEQALVKNIP